MPATFSTLPILLAAILAAPLVSTQQTIVYPTTAGPSATPIPTGIDGYTYVGCWNETTGIPGTGGARALQQGQSTASNVMTINQCLSFCESTQYAGLEYGRECYCGAYLSVLSTPLDAAACEFACDGNASEICGGSLALTLYNRTAAAGGKKTGAGAAGVPGAAAGGAWWAVAAVVMVVFAGVL